MRPSERVAKLLIERAIPGADARPVPSQSQGEWDFNVHIGAIAFPLEVTQATSEKSESLHAALFARDGEASIVPRSRAKKSWAVTVSRRSNIRAIRKRLDELVADLEATGFTTFDIQRYSTPAPQAIQALWDELMITDGFSTSAWEIDGHALMPPRDSAMLSSDQVVSAVTREADKDDNRRKLGRSNALEKHLFVHIAYHCYPAHEAMRSCGIPARALRLPPEITHVWVARGFGDSQWLLWAFDAGGWRSHDMITIHP